MKIARRLNSRHNASERRGAALVEMAVCLPVFMLTLLGIVEFGRAMSVSQILNTAAREGCRAAILDGSSNASVKSAVASRVSTMVNCPQNVVNVQVAITSASSNNSVSDLTNAKPRDEIVISVTVPHSAVSYSVSKFLEGKTIRGQCAMRHE